MKNKFIIIFIPLVLLVAILIVAVTGSYNSQVMTYYKHHRGFSFEYSAEMYQIYSGNFINTWFKEGPTYINLDRDIFLLHTNYEYSFYKEAGSLEFLDIGNPAPANFTMRKSCPSWMTANEQIDTDEHSYYKSVGD